MKNHLILLAISFLATVNISCGQHDITFEVAFEKTFNFKQTHQIDDLISLSDGGLFLVGGAISRNLTISEMRKTKQLPTMIPCVMRTDKTGKLLWTKYYPELEAIAVLKSIHEVGKNKYLVIGNHGYFDKTTFSLEMDAQGNFSAFKEFGESTGRIRRVKSLDGKGFIMAGNLKLKMLLAKADSKGKIEWHKSYSPFGSHGNYAEGFDVLPTRGGYFITGTLGKKEQVQFAVLKTSEKGDSLWARVYSPERSRALVLKNTRYRNHFLVGGMYDSGGNAKKAAFLVKFNQKGDTLWTRRFGHRKGNELVDIRVSHGNYTAIVNTNRSSEKHSRKGLITLYTFSKDGKLKGSKFLETALDTEGWRAKKILSLGNKEFIILATSYDRGTQTTTIIKIKEKAK